MMPLSQFTTPANQFLAECQHYVSAFVNRFTDLYSPSWVYVLHCECEICLIVLPKLKVVMLY